MRVQSKGFAIFSKDGHFKPHDFSRHAVGPKDVLIDILYAGFAIAIFIALIANGKKAFIL